MWRGIISQKGKGRKGKKHVHQYELSHDPMLWRRIIPEEPEVGIEKWDQGANLMQKALSSPVGNPPNRLETTYHNKHSPIARCYPWFLQLFTGVQSCRILQYRH